MKRLVILDGYTTNPGDLSFKPFEEFGEVVAYDRTAQNETIERAKGCEIVLTNKTVFSRDVFAALPDLRYLGAMSTGYNVIDTKAAREFGVTVTNVPEYATFATAQMTIALLLELTNRVGSHSAHVREGAWAKSVDFCFTDGPMTELWGKTLGLYGYGRIARRAGLIASALGMRVIATSRTIEARLKNPAFSDTPSGGFLPEDDGLIAVTAEELLRQSDVISCHCPLTPETRDFIREENIAKMKDGVLLINTSRGPVFHEADVAAGLHAGKIGGVAVDVLSKEPMDPINPLLTAPNCIITPHIAWAPRETRQRLLDTVYQNIAAYKAGHPVNVVS